MHYSSLTPYNRAVSSLKFADIFSPLLADTDNSFKVTQPVIGRALLHLILKS